MKVSGIYKIENLIDGKIYIGQTVNYRRRRKSHLSSLKRNNHHNEHLQRAFNKYGEESFGVELLEECSADNLDEVEIKYIRDLEACDNSKGYNLMFGGQTYRKFTKETRMKMSKSRKGIKFSDEHRKNIGLGRKGIRNSEESIKKMRETKVRLMLHIGEKNINAIVSDELAKQIILDLIEGFPVKEISEKYQVSGDVVYNLMYNRSYTHIMPEVREELAKRTSKLDGEKIEASIKMYLEGHSQNEVAKTFNISRNTLRRELKSRDIDTQKHRTQHVKNANTEVTD